MGYPKAPCVPLRRFGGGGMSLLAYSPDSSKVLSATPSNMFRLWETHTWTCETWTKLTSRIQSAVWSHDGSLLLFSCADECSIYCVHFSAASGEKQSSDLTYTDRAVICADLKNELVETETGEMVSVGGPIQSLAWDQTSERLAVQFGGIAAAYIAVFETRLKPILELVPCGFIRGHAGEIPNIISFQPKVKTGALLTVIWSSGRLSHIPMYFIPAMSIETSHISRVAVGNGQTFNKFLFTSASE
jgi:aladin